MFSSDLGVFISISGNFQIFLSDKDFMLGVSGWTIDLLLFSSFKDVYTSTFETFYDSVVHLQTQFLLFYVLVLYPIFVLVPMRLYIHCHQTRDRTCPRSNQICSRFWR